MNEFIGRFKRIVAQVRDETGVNFHHLGLRDLLIDAGNDPSPAELAARAAISFCKEDNRYNGSEPGLLVVISLICETCTSLPMREEDATDALIDLLDGDANYRDLLTWTSQFYRP